MSRAGHCDPATARRLCPSQVPNLEKVWWVSLLGGLAPLGRVGGWFRQLGWQHR